MFSLARALHKTVAEIEAMTADEFAGWLAFFKMERDGGRGGK